MHIERGARCLAFVVAIGLLSSPRETRAEACPAGLGASALAGRDSEERLRFIQSSLERAAGPARRWSWGWALGYSAVATAQLGLAPFIEDDGRQADFYVGGARTALAVVPFVALPLKVMRAERALTERLSSQSAEDRCALVAEAEQWLAASARAEERGRSWVKHTAVVTLNVVAGLVLGLGFDRWPQAAFTASTGIAVGEIMILTQPTQSVEALRRYREGHLTSQSPLGLQLAWVITPAVSGGGRFGLMAATSF
ncbi:MAG TPA: hypothetical protein VGF45_12615 [Polyangia bacterium]